MPALNGRLANWAQIVIAVLLILGAAKAYGNLEQRVADLEQTCAKLADPK